MKTSTLLIITCLFVFNFSFSQDIELELFASGLSDPIGIKHAGDNRLFVLERSGTIKIIDQNGTVNNTSFLDISNIISSGGERGLLGLAFHPNYSSNGYFYVNYTNSNGDTVIARYTVSTNNPDIADNNSGTILLTISQPYSNHNGGDLAFGNDGYLYIATGDGGSGGDPGDRAQDLSTLLGKLLRIDVDNGTPYGIPNDNPFANDGDNTTLPEIWAYGLRNPWRFSFDRATNDLWIADVGQNNIEEINMVSLTNAGVNYGWRCYEGNDTYNTTGNCPDISTLTFPIAQYTHSGNGPFKCSITGGYRYRGLEQPSMTGWYFFADYCSNEIGILSYDGANWNMTFTEQFDGNNWTAFGEDSSGEIYVAGISSGNIYKIINNDLSVEENQFINVAIYPNPTYDSITISSNYSKPYQVNMYSILGKKVFTKEIQEKNKKISVENLQSGLYLVEIISDSNKKQLQKLIIK
ncbi:PQQ-dependent sugar dehydrogenase [Mangrovimonas spongiae]|uniref:T9SS C-terminal target domain-containing protein n=1 Tax=Mangrovimonas spongiae TaxID=2494697 RepID=A0A3R9NL13_9FLAO|nr:PQQ-dependent sugar dehydrogenase [Mangrovimonas spongiae]RSK38305.1 T9SS C-terminal target domain-containing protein [Mangrovimonas spongiae]